MKKLLLFSAFLALTFFATGNVAFARNESANTDYSQKEGFERLLEKIQEEDSLPEKTKQKCVDILKESIHSGKVDSHALTPAQKQKINECIDAMYSKKFEVMEQKIEALSTIIKKLKRLGKNTKVLEQNLRQAKGRLKLLKESF